MPGTTLDSSHRRRRGDRGIARGSPRDRAARPRRGGQARPGGRRLAIGLAALALLVPGPLPGPASALAASPVAGAGVTGRGRTGDAAPVREGHLAVVR